jgi:hypothetical protein
MQINREDLYDHINLQPLSELSSVCFDSGTDLEIKIQYELNIITSKSLTYLERAIN